MAPTLVVARIAVTNHKDSATNETGGLISSLHFDSAPNSSDTLTTDKHGLPTSRAQEEKIQEDEAKNEGASYVWFGCNITLRKSYTVLCFKLISVTYVADIQYVFS